ncbi:hypothetical protein [Ruminococcus albus]|uniref:SynChlorMet cassette protein ScmC n=1 Tax=Ruminococcus albus TaxID=1264 RepID=A0A1H7LB18_RUMAL|nr:hypothetical protein [Ruminococcus albus]SEK96006.1 hypothetical protein SAMN05216469_108136 [Ruminococcus albus]
MDFTIRLAGVNIAVNSIYEDVYRLCRDYITDSKPNLSISTSAEDIAREKEMNKREAAAEGIPVTDYPDGYLETLAVYRKIAAQILAFDTFLMHGAVVAVQNKAWLFTAPSGTGKTTHIRLWLENIEGSYIVNGDKPFIHIGEKIMVYGTPWAGKEGMQKNIGVELAGIVFLERGTNNHIEREKFSKGLPVLVQQSYRPNNKTDLEKTLNLLGRLGRRIPLYRLSCNMDKEAALTAYEMLSHDCL